VASSTGKGRRIFLVVCLRPFVASLALRRREGRAPGAAYLFPTKGTNGREAKQITSHVSIL
jgi:hypothetical protein